MLLAQQAGQEALVELITNRFFKVFRVAVAVGAVKAIFARIRLGEDDVIASKPMSMAVHLHGCGERVGGRRKAVGTSSFDHDVI